jgi:hypothetical protein
MTEPKFCINCKHFQPIEHRLPQCRRPVGVSLVDGSPQFKNISAGLERTLDCTGCGEKAVYFEPKE